MPRMEAADRRKAILRAAGALFTARGFAGVTMEDVLAVVGGSKSTLYKHFTDKTELFRAAVEHLLDEQVKPLHSFRCPDADLRTTLTALGAHFAAVVLDPRSIAVHRLVTAEAERVPGLGAAFFAHAPAVGMAVMGRYLQRACDAGLIALADPEKAAGQLYMAMLGDAQMRLLTGSPHPFTDDEIRDSIESAVRIFLDGVGVRAG